MWPFNSRAQVVDVISASSVVTLAGDPVLSGAKVSENSVRALPAYHCGVMQIADALASSEWNVMQLTGLNSNEGREYRQEHPLYRVLNVSPHPRMDGYQYKKLLLRDLLYKGWHLSHPVYDEGGRCIRLTRMNLDLVQVIPPELSEAHHGEYIYRYPSGGGKWIDYREDQLFKVLGLSADGITGISPISHFAETLGVSIAAEQYGARFFGRGGRVSGILSSIRQMIGREEVDQVAMAFKKAQEQDGGQGVAVLSGGWEYKPVSLTPAESQFLETRQYGVRDVSRILKIPPTKLMDMEFGTYSNAEQESLSYVRDTLTPWARNIESAVRRQLLSPHGRFVLEIDMTELSRGDLLHQSRALRVLLGTGKQVPMISLDEARRLLNFGKMKDEELAKVLDALKKISETDNNQRPGNAPGSSPGGDTPS